MEKTYTETSLASSDFVTLRLAAFDHFQSRHVTMLSYHHYPPFGAIDFRSTITVAAVGFPDDWVKEYTEGRYYENDPIVRRARHATRAFSWSDATGWTDLTGAEERFLKRLGQVGIGEGLAVPVFGPDNRNGYFGMGFADGKTPSAAPERSDLQWACQLTHLRYCELLAAILPKPVLLSRREKEVLRLVAAGRTNSQIAQTMNVTPHTISTYLSRAFEKLDVRDRMTAALRGLSAGLLD